MIAGSGGLLAAETFGYSRSSPERDVPLDVVSDVDAYLGLTEGTEDGVESSGVLFDDGTAAGVPPATFAVANQVAEPLSIALTVDDPFRFDSPDGEGGTLTLGHGETDPLSPGEALEPVTVDLDPRTALPPFDEQVTGTVTIEGDGDGTSIEAARSLALVSDVLLTIDLTGIGTVPDVLIVLRKRRADEASPSYVVETVDAETGDANRVREVSCRPKPTLRLTFPAATHPDLEIDACPRVDVDQFAASVSSAAADDGDGDDSATGGDDPALVVDPDVTADATDRVERIDVPLEV
ncbi:hypothetical protein [Halopiger djelfimassiliensis]|uniref:hypothetical protein n=1 Tax=Halopiger djelfimassiliensis TaxID=1293047 RepID=UPI000678144F|nr:hypothetical protein [Halopiger djelfimassiliensis]